MGVTTIMVQLFTGGTLSKLNGALNLIFSRVFYTAFKFEILPQQNSPSKDYTQFYSSLMQQRDAKISDENGPFI